MSYIKISSNTVINMYNTMLKNQHAHANAHYDSCVNKLIGKRIGFLWLKKITNRVHARHWLETKKKRFRQAQVDNMFRHVNQRREQIYQCALLSDYVNMTVEDIGSFAKWQ